MKNKSPAFQFYPDDWLGSRAIALMKPCHEGAYIRLLCYQWNDPTCTLPNNSDQLKVLSRLGSDFKPAWSHLKHVFVPFPTDNTRVYNVRLYEERIKQQQFRDGKSRAGRQGAVARWGQENTEDQGTKLPPKPTDGKPMAVPSRDGRAIPLPMAKDSSSFSSPSSSSNKTTKGGKTDISSAIFLASQYRAYISKSISSEKCQQEFADALKRGLGAGGMNAAIECQWNVGMKVWDWIKIFEKEYRKKEAKPEIFRASDEKDRKPYPPSIQKMLAEATNRMTLHPKEKPDADHDHRKPDAAKPS